MVHLGSLLIGLWLPSHREHCLLDSSGQLKQPDGPIGVVNKVLATHWVGARVLNLLSVRRLVELLRKVVVFYFKIIILAKKAEACFVTSLICGV